MAQDMVKVSPFSGNWPKQMFLPPEYFCTFAPLLKSVRFAQCSYTEKLLYIIYIIR